MSVHILDQAIIASLQPLFEEAQEKGLWFFHNSPDGEELWMSPEFLKLKQSHGEHVMAPEHWELRNPSGYMKKLHADAKGLVDEYNAMADRLKLDETMELTIRSADPERAS